MGDSQEDKAFNALARSITSSMDTLDHHYVLFAWPKPQEGVDTILRAADVRVYGSGPYKNADAVIEVMAGVEHRIEEI